MTFIVVVRVGSIYVFNFSYKCDKVYFLFVTKVDKVSFWLLRKKGHIEKG